MYILKQLACDALHTVALHPVALFRTVRTVLLRRMVLFCSENIDKQYLFKIQFNTTQKSMVD